MVNKPLQLNLTLRAKITLIGLVTTSLIIVSMIIAGNLIQNVSKQQYSAATIKGKSVLWKQITTNRLNELKLGMRHLSRDRTTLEALAKNDVALLAEAISTTYNRLSASEILDHLVIVNTNGNILYTSRQPDASTSTTSATTNDIALETIRETKVMYGVELDAAGKISLVCTFPLYSSGTLVGAGIYSKNINDAVKEFSQNDSSSVYIVGVNSDVQYGTDIDLYNSLTIELPSIEKENTLAITQDEHVYGISISPVINHKNVPIGRLISIGDATESYEATREIQFVAYGIIAVLTALSLLGLFLYLRHSLSPLGKLMDTVSELAKGNTSIRSDISTNDEFGQLSSAFNNMAQRIQDSIDTERQNAEDVKGKVELILDGVECAANGDLTSEMMVFRESDAISQLASGIQKMLDNLNSLVSQVRKSGVQVAASANQIAATAKQQEATITEQVATSSEIVATSKQISSTSKELLLTMEEVADVSHNTSISAESGRQALSQMENTMEQMVGASSAITSKLAVLNEKAQNINTVVTTITKVADQTNLLSLNAAIEAEKAGEYGVGFSVVATEIRRLADQTAVATWDIEQIVQEMQSAVSAGVMGMDKFSEEVRSGVSEVNKVGEQLSNIIEQVQNLIPKFENVHEGMQSQSTGAAQITESIIQLNDASQQTAESLHQSNDSIARLNDAAHTLQDGISVFKINDK